MRRRLLSYYAAVLSFILHVFPLKCVVTKTILLIILKMPLGCFERTWLNIASRNELAMIYTFEWLLGNSITCFRYKLRMIVYKFAVGRI